jgi:actin-related protein
MSMVICVVQKMSAAARKPKPKKSSESSAHLTASDHTKADEWKAIKGKDDDNFQFEKAVHKTTVAGNEEERTMSGTRLIIEHEHNTTKNMSHAVFVFQELEKKGDKYEFETFRHFVGEALPTDLWCKHALTTHSRHSFIHSAIWHS